MVPLDSAKKYSFFLGTLALFLGVFALGFRILGRRRISEVDVTFQSKFTRGMDDSRIPGINGRYGIGMRRIH